MTKKEKVKMGRKIFSLLMALCLLFQQVGFAEAAATQLNISGYFAKLSGGLVSDTFRPPHLRFFLYDQKSDNLKVMLDRGDIKDLKGIRLDEITQELLNYFLVGVSLPNQSFWVNLRPDSPDNIIDRELARTDVGKIMLETDLQLKKDTALLTSPNTNEGKEYWRRIYKKAEALYGYEEVTIPTLARPWIVPNEVIVREVGGSAYIYKATLKVMLEQDHLKDSSVYNFKDSRAKLLNDYAAQQMRELILPKLTKEINLSKRYAGLRQVYYSIIFSRWFKSRFSGKSGKYVSLINTSNLSNLSSKTSWSKTDYFNAYKKSFIQGEYNVKEVVRTPTGQVIRTYFSGGNDLRNVTINGASGLGTGILGALKTVGLISPDRFNPNIGSNDKGNISSSPIQVTGLGDLIPVIRQNNINSAILSLDWNVALDEDGKIADNERIVNSLETIKWALDDADLEYLFMMTHSGRPSGKGYEESFSLRPMADEASRLLQEEGVTNLKVVLLPYDLEKAKLEIEAEKAVADPGEKFLFVIENIRMYAGEQSKDPAVRENFEKQIITLTSQSVDKLVYVIEAFDKSHRGEEASMEMGHLLFPADHISAGAKLGEEAQKVLAFLSRVTGKLAVIAGGAKFDNLKTFAGDLGGRVANSGGTLIFVGALANPVMVNKGKAVGKSLMPKPDEQKATNDALKKLNDNIRDKKLKIMIPSDVILRDGRAVKDIGPEEAGIDIGSETTKAIVDYINSLTEGDGLVVNGGAGVFDKDWGSKAGTIAIVSAANQAAKRGVAVFFAGGDMSNAVKIVVKETGLEMDPSILGSTGGGALLTALGKGVGNLIPLRAVMKFKDATARLIDIYEAIEEALPGAMILNATRTPYIDTSVDGQDDTREPALELSRAPNGTHQISLPKGRRVDDIKNFYETTFMPVIVTAEDVEAMPDGLKLQILGAKKEKDATAVAQKIIRPVLVAKGIPTQDSQDRSHLLDPGKLGEAGVDVSSIIAIKTRQGDFLIFVPVVVKSGEETAHQALASKVSTGLAKKQESLNKEMLTLPDRLMALGHEEVYEALVKYTPSFFDGFQKGDISRAGMLADIVNSLEVEKMVDPAVTGIVFDKDLGLFISSKDNDEKATAPGFGKNLERFRGSLFRVGETSARIYQLVTPLYDTEGKVGIAVNNKKLQDAVIRFYARMQRHLLQVATEHFNDPRVFESLRVEVGDYAQRLNKALRNHDALELSQASAEAIINHLSEKGVDLTWAEQDNVRELFRNSGSFFDILQLAAALRTETFVKSFRHLKLDSPREVMPSDKPYEAYDGSGRIGRMLFALRLAEDINYNEKGYIGRYMIASQTIKGQTMEEKLKSAEQKVREMLSDRQIEDSKTSILVGEESVFLSELIKSGRMYFKAGLKVLTAQLDFQDTDQIPSVYGVDIILDGRVVGIAYCVDVAQFKAGLEEALKARGRSLDNIPRPFIIYGENNEHTFFGLRVDATPGGVEIGDQELEAAGAEGTVKLSGDTLWKLFAKFNLPEPKGKSLTAADEFARIKQIYKQVDETRMPIEGGKKIIYDKAQIPKSMILPGFNSLGRHLGWAIPYVGGANVMFVTPGSCSTNGASHAIAALSTLSGSVDALGPTFHMYTSSDNVPEKNVFGHTALKSTGAAKGVVLLLYAGDGGQIFFTAIRTPTGLINGKGDIVGGSMFDLLIRLPNNISEDLIRRYLSRVAQEFPQDLRFFTPGDKQGDSYTWKDTIAGQKTGSILYSDFIEQVGPGQYRIKVGYDNEMSFGSKQFSMHEGAYMDIARARQTEAMKDVLSKALKSTASSPLSDKNNDGLGGIDFRSKAMQITYQPMGNFAELDTKLPYLSQGQLAKFDAEVELANMEKMVNRDIVPSGQRIKEAIAACAQKGELNLFRERISVLLVRVGILEEKYFCMQDASKEFKEALVLVEL